MQSKNQSEPAKTRFRPRLVQRPKKTAVSVFFGPGPVFLVLGNVWTGLGLGLIFLGQKTGLDWTFEHYLVDLVDSIWSPPGFHKNRHITTEFSGVHLEFTWSPLKSIWTPHELY